MRRLRLDVPLWLDRVPKARRPVFPRFRGDDRADVVIVGGGLTGCLVAALLAESRGSVILLEGDAIGQGSTARSLGLVSQDVGVPFTELRASHGLRMARRTAERLRLSGRELVSYLRRRTIRCDLRLTDGLLVAFAKEDVPALVREHRARVDAGLDIVSLTGQRARREAGNEAQAVLKVKQDAMLDPYRACLGIAAHAGRKGAHLFDRSAVRGLKHDRGRTRVILADGRIEADTVVVATGDAGGPYRQLRRHLRRVDRYTVATPALAPALAREFGSRSALLDSATPPHRLCWTRDGRVLFQGGDQAAVPQARHERAVRQRTAQLMYELSLRYPAISGVPPEYGWSGRRVTGADGLPFVGSHRNFPRHLFALGLGGFGIGGAWLAARTLVRHVLGQPAAGDDDLGFGR